MCMFFLTDTTIKLVIQSLVLSHLDYCPAIWSGTSKKELAKLQLDWHFTVLLGIMHDKLSWMKVEEILACSLILYLNNICTSCKPSSLFSLLVPTKITRTVLKEVES